MKVKLRKEKPLIHDTFSQVQWVKAPPFIVPIRGHLIHRVRSAKSHLTRGNRTHDSVRYWCGNGGCCNGRDGVRREFVEDPPTDRLLCEFCEAKAVAAGESSADQLAGRHVHKGRMKPKKTCCTDEHN